MAEIKKARNLQNQRKSYFSIYIYISKNGDVSISTLTKDLIPLAHELNSEDEFISKIYKERRECYEQKYIYSNKNYQGE